MIPQEMDQAWDRHLGTVVVDRDPIGDLRHQLWLAHNHEAKCRRERDNALADYCDAAAEARDALPYLGRPCESGHYAEGVHNDANECERLLEIAEAKHWASVVRAREAAEALRKAGAEALRKAGAEALRKAGGAR